MISREGSTKDPVPARLMRKYYSASAKLAKAAAVIAVALFIVCLPQSESSAQIGPFLPEPETDLKDIKHGKKEGPIPNDEFRALAATQLEVISLMCGFYFLENGKYPETLYDLIASPYWIANINNLFTDEPIQEILFQPTDFNFEPDPIAQYLAERGMQDSYGNGSQGREGEGGEGESYLSQPFQEPRRIIPPKLDPDRIGALEPGNVLFYPQGADSLQMIIWMTSDVYAEYYQTTPLSNAITRHELVKMVHPSDIRVLATAILIEVVLPRGYSRWQFHAEQDPLLPIDIPGLTWSKRIEISEKLKVWPRNPFTKQALSLVTSYIPGMVADIGTGGVPPVYCLEGNRLRTLRELTDKEYLIANRDAIIARERMFTQ